MLCFINISSASQLYESRIKMFLFRLMYSDLCILFANRMSMILLPIAFELF